MALRRRERSEARRERRRAGLLELLKMAAALGREGDAHGAAVLGIGLADVLSSLTATQRQRVRAAFNDLRDVVSNESFIATSQSETSLRTTKGHKEIAHAR